MNSGLLQMGGYTNEEVVNRPFTDFVGEEEVAILSDSYLRRMRGRRCPRYERLV